MNPWESFIFGFVFGVVLTLGLLREPAWLRGSVFRREVPKRSPERAARREAPYRTRPDEHAETRFKGHHYTLLPNLRLRRKVDDCGCAYTVCPECGLEAQLPDAMTPAQFEQSCLVCAACWPIFFGRSPADRTL